MKRIFNRIFPCRFNEPLCEDSFFGCKCGKGETTIQAAPTTPAPNPSETAEAQYAAKLKYDPLISQAEFNLQQQYVPQQTALYSSLYNQYYPQMARQQQQLQQELFPQQSQILESGATQALQQLQQPQSALLQALGLQAQAGLTPSGYTPEQQSAVEAIRGRELQRTQQGLRERSNLGGTLYGGRGQELESRATQQLGQQFAAEDIDRMMMQRQAALSTASGVAGQQMQAQQMAQQNLNPYMSILYPQIGQQQPQISPYQYQSAVPSADTLYNAYFQASQPQYFASQGYSPWGDIMGLGGQLGGAAILGNAMKG